jgi:hypothetical protein
MVNFMAMCDPVLRRLLGAGARQTPSLPIDFRSMPMGDLRDA